MLEKLMLAGMNVARVNCSHGTLEDNRENIKLIQRVRDRVNPKVKIVLDTKGPDVRIGFFEHHEAQVEAGQTFTLYADPSRKDVLGNSEGVYVDYEQLPKRLKVGQELRLNDGIIIAKVTGVTDTTVEARIVFGGSLRDRKSLAAPGVDLGLQFLSQNDVEDLKMGVNCGVEWVAASFVSRAIDVLALRTLLEDFGGHKIKIISKIENRFAIKNIDEIINVSDGIMVARGDLGVEIDVEQIPVLQRMIIKKTREAGKIAITATEMMESMIYRPRPTRAEVTDVANAVWDGTQYTMLSGETAAGKYPLRSLEYMVRIASYAETHDDHYRLKPKPE